jgi:dihydrofolate reductase
MAAQASEVYGRGMARTRVFVGASLDGFIAGPNDELDWLGGGPSEEPNSGPSEGQAEAHASFRTFFAQIGAVLMGRRTYDVVSAMTGPWIYGETPMLIATSRPLPAGRPSVRAVQGSIAELVERASAVAGERDVYVDGGKLIRSALDAGLVDEITVTIVPVVIGAGIPLFAGVARHHRLELIGQRTIAGAAVELTYRPRKRASGRR